MFDSISLSYSDFKDIVLSKKIRPQYILVGNQYQLFAYDTPIKYEAIVWNDMTGVEGLDVQGETANKSDFLETLAPISNRCLLTSPIAALSKFHKGKIELTAEETEGYCEWSFDHDVEINKVRPKPISALFGDYVTMEVWSKQGVTIPGVTEGTPVKLEDFGDGIYLAGGDGCCGEWYAGSGGGKIPVYATVRCYYHKAAGTERKFLIDAEFYV